MKAAIIPARGGSKRISKKNIKLFDGKPIISYSIEAALESNLFDRVIVSSDDEEIKKIAFDLGAETPFTRPKNLSDDHVPINPVIKHAIENSGIKDFDYICCIFATAPFIQIKDLKEAFDKMKQDEFSFIFSATSYVHPIERSFLKDKKGKGLKMLYPDKYSTRSQDLKEYFHDAGQFYWGKTNQWLKEKMNFDKNSDIYFLPPWRVQDIDSLDDWKRAELIFEILKNS